VNFEMRFDERYKIYKERIEDYMKPLFRKTIFNKSELSKVIHYSLEAGGKRIRPVLTLAFCEAYGGDTWKALRVATAIEMLHTSTLIQDDLPCMDDDNERRGKPACHKAFSEADAILAASSMAFQAIKGLCEVRSGEELMGAYDEEYEEKMDEEKGKKSYVRLKIINEICRGMANVYDGQKLELDGHEDKMEIFALKTGALIQTACICGVLAAGGDMKAIENASNYGWSLGLAFQVVDDILDGEGNDFSRMQAEHYTKSALESLENVPDNEFLILLTKNLLNRKK